MKKHFILKLVIVAAIFITGIMGCKKDSNNTVAANLAWVGNYAGTVSIDVNSGGGSGADTLRVTALSASNQITMFDVLDSITFTGTVNGTSVAITATQLVPGYSAEIYNGNGTLISGIFTGTVTGSYTYGNQTYRDTISYTMVKH